jgi:hypothetical protein
MVAVWLSTGTAGHAHRPSDAAVICFFERGGIKGNHYHTEALTWAWIKQVARSK